MISADLFGPLPRSTNGHEYVLVITDYFSKFPLFVPVRSPTARKVIDEIERRVFLMFGVPEFIIVDNGVQFGRSREFQNFLNNYGVKPYYNSLYTPQNNPTERVNRTMKSLIVSYTDQDQRKWDENLDRVACALRTAKHEATKQTPYLLNFGNEMIDHGTGHELRRTRESLDDGAEANPLGEQVTESKLDKVRRVVTGLINRYRDRAKRYYDAKRREVEYAVGDLVWKRSYPTTDGTKHFSAKLAKPFVGPFTITERLGKNVYALVDDLGVYKGKWHVKDLKPDHTRESEDDHDSSCPEFTGREYEDSDGGSDTSSNE
jgi:ribosomal protein S17E